jgi:CubicO group peptidase (beta-lactamase class C family)
MRRGDDVKRDNTVNDSRIGAFGSDGKFVAISRRIAAGLLILGLSGCAITYDVVVQRDELGSAPILSADRIAESHRFLTEKTAFDAFVARKGNAEITRWGMADTPINTHSVRKSILSALYGIAEAKGLIDLSETLEQLGVDEPRTPLTATEKSATIRDLLMSRSGIYLEAAGETSSIRDGRPRRGQHKPGTHFFYNNWDFNVLGVIFEKRTGLTVGEALEAWIAKPVGMTAFRADHVIYRTESSSQYRQFVVYMSASDLARFGSLYVNAGRLDNVQVVPERWIEQSLQRHSMVDQPQPFDGYGYMWWLDSKANVAWADGWRGQYMIVDRVNKLVVVSRNDTGRNLLTHGWAVLFGRDGFRDHHQHLHKLMMQATGTN